MIQRERERERESHQFLYFCNFFKFSSEASALRSFIWFNEKAKGKKKGKKK